jgi:outer membrane protein OmpA-like peptidoglycan-associated protein
MIRFRILLAIGLLLAAAPESRAADCNGAYLDADTVAQCLKPHRFRNIKHGQTQQPAEAPASVNLWVHFDFDSATLGTDARISLDQVAQALATPALATLHFTIAGHTDAAGTAEYNQALSLRRADAVRNYLVQNGSVSAARLQIEGLGFTQPLNPADPLAAENRRVEIRTAAPG